MDSAASRQCGSGDKLQLELLGLPSVLFLPEPAEVIAHPEECALQPMHAHMTPPAERDKETQEVHAAATVMNDDAVVRAADRALPAVTDKCTLAQAIEVLGVMAPGEIAPAAHAAREDIRGATTAE